MLQVADAVHGLGPAVVAQQVERHEFEPRDVGAGRGQGVADLVGLAEVAHAAADGVAGLEQLQGDMAAEKAGNAGDKDAIGHDILSPLAIERNV